MHNLFPLATAAAPQLLTIAECRKQCRVDHEDEDAELIGFAAAAQGWVETFTGRALTPRPAVVHADCWGPWRIVGGPVGAVDGIGYTDADGAAQVLAPADYLVREHLGLAVVRLRTAVTPPALAADSGITISLTVGYTPATLPPELKQACLMLVGHWYQSREGVAKGATAEVPLAVESLCIRHRLMVLA